MMDKRRTFLVVASVVSLIVMGYSISFSETGGLHMRMLWRGGNKSGIDTFTRSAQVQRVSVMRPNTFENVCVGYTKEQTNIRRMNIMVFNAQTKSTKKLAVTGFRFSRKDTWALTFVPQTIPSNYSVTTDVAFFVFPKCPGNLHHFLHDEVSALYATVKRENRLGSENSNRLIYGLDFYNEHTHVGCNNIDHYNKFLSTLNFQPYNKSLYGLGTFTCYPRAIFGVIRTTDRRAVIQHIITRLAINRTTCDPRLMTIIHRQERRILNTEEMKSAAIAMGFKRVEIAVFESMSIDEQIRLAVCSRIIIGVQGAGLQWATFMRPGSYLLEVAWPEKRWPFIYKRFVKQYAIRYGQIRTQDVQINWEVYEKNVRRGKKVSQEERLRLLSKQRGGWDFDNIWKWADVKVNVASFKSQLSATNI